MSWLRRRGQDEGGAVLVLTALTMVVIIGSAALAVDIGQLTSKRRDLQKVADAVALDTSRAINGTSVSVLSAPTGAVTLAAQKSAARNNFPFTQLTVTLGFKNGTSDFVAATSGSDIPNAVEIVAREVVDYSFAPGTQSTSRRAVAGQYATSGLSAGSFLVGTTDEQDTVLNSIFGDAFGAQVLSYNGLAAANVTIEELGLEWPTGVLTPDQVLTSNLSFSDFLLASADVLRNDGDLVAAGILDNMRLSMTSDTSVNLDEFLIVEQGGAAAAASAELNVLEMLTTMAFIADGTHAINIPATQLTIPGIGGVTLNLEVLEAAQKKWGPVGTSVSTAQVRATITPTINVSTTSNVNGCSIRNTLGALLSLNLTEVVQCNLINGFVSRIISLNLSATIPITLEAAGADATIDAINCGAPQSMVIGMEAMPLTLTSNVDLVFTGTLLGNSLGNVMRVRATGGVTTNSPASDQTFLYPSQFGVPRSVGVEGLSAAGLTNLQVSNTTLLNANLGNVTNVLATSVLSIANSTMVQLNNNLVAPLNNLLGLSLGGADLTALEDFECHGVRLSE